MLTLVGMRPPSFLHSPPLPSLIRNIATLIGAAMLLLSAVPASAQVTWRMTTEYPQNNISGIGLVTFSKLVAERTGGFVTTTPAFDNDLKITSSEMPRAALDGRIAGGDAFSGPLSSLDPVFGLSTLPFVVQSIETARAANARARPLYEKALAAQGLKLLYLTVWPSSGLWSDRPIADATAMASLIVRTYD